MNQDQTAPVGAVWSGSTLFAEEASNIFQQLTKVDNYCLIGALRVNFQKSTCVSKSTLLVKETSNTFQQMTKTDDFVVIGSLTLYLPLSSANNLCKQIGPRSGPTKCRAWSGSNLFDTQMVFLKEFLEKVNFEKNQQTTKKHEQFPRGQRVKVFLLNCVIRPNKKIPVFRVTRPFLNLLVKLRKNVQVFSKNTILCILKGKMPFKMHKIIFFFRIFFFFFLKFVCLSYLKFSDPLHKTNLFFYLA